MKFFEVAKRNGLHPSQRFRKFFLPLSAGDVAHARSCHQVAFVRSIDKTLGRKSFAIFHDDRLDGGAISGDRIRGFRQAVPQEDLHFRLGKPIRKNLLGDMRFKVPRQVFAIVFPHTLKECSRMPSYRSRVSDVGVAQPPACHSP